MTGRIDDIGIYNRPLSAAVRMMCVVGCCVYLRSNKIASVGAVAVSVSNPGFSVLAASPKASGLLLRVEAQRNTTRAESGLIAKAVTSRSAACAGLSRTGGVLPRSGTAKSSWASSTS